MNFLNETIQNSVFHFTGKDIKEPLDVLISILKNGFYPRYNWEFLDNIIKPLDKTEHVWGVPMVCFCGLGLNKIRPHADKFGNYAFGLKEEWALKHKINPVIYMIKDSIVVEKYNEMYKHFLEEYLKNKNAVKWYGFLKFSVYINDYYFYDEREWRYVPDLEKEPHIHRVLDSIYLDSKYSDLIIENENLKLRKKPLIFESNDINYILIPRKEIEELNEKLKQLDRDKSNDLLKKIISLEEVMNKYG